MSDHLTHIEVLEEEIDVTKVVLDATASKTSVPQTIPSCYALNDSRKGTYNDPSRPAVNIIRHWITLVI